MTQLRFDPLTSEITLKLLFNYFWIQLGRKKEPSISHLPSGELQVSRSRKDTFPRKPSLGLVPMEKGPGLKNKLLTMQSISQICIKLKLSLNLSTLSI